MEFIDIYNIALLVILGCMTILWLVSLWLKNSSIVDIFWGTGFITSFQQSTLELNYLMTLTFVFPFN